MPSRLLFFSLLIFYSPLIKAQEFRVDTAYSAQDMVQNHFLSTNHQGIQLNKIKYTGLNNGLGLFFYVGNGAALSSQGLVLSSGSVLDAMGPNNTTASNENYLEGDEALSKIAHSKTFDTAILEFDFMSLTDSIHFSFQFASEEYPEYVSKGVSDVFGFFVSDSSNHTRNIATIKQNGVPISVDLINANFNADYYVINNEREYHFNGDERRDLLFYENKRLFQFDGFTKTIHTGLRLEAFTPYHFKIAIADAGDRKFDSWVFLKGNSFISNGELKNPEMDDLRAYFSFLQKDRVEIQRIDGEIHILLPIYFNFNSHEILTESFDVLEPVLQIINYSKYNLLIHGFADEVGSTDYNLKLSQQRADEVQRYFVQKGINQNRLKSVGKGELKSSRDTMKSRKVEFILK